MSETAQGAQSGPVEHQFQAEVSRVLDIVINSLYSHREVFLRELISNAADAIDKLRFRALTETGLKGDDEALEIRIVPNEKAGTLTITDTGIGMSREDLIENLGTIARSGSKRFLDALEGADRSKVDIIGQFGVGFYSGFIVADKVEVRSRAAGAEEAWCWTSDGRGSFTIESDDDLAGRGTAITLHLKDDAKDFLKEYELRTLIKRYSDFVSFPIKLSVERKKEDSEETERKLEQINRGQPLWRRPKSEVTDEDYEELYKHVASDWEKPLDRVHFKAEGTLEFTGVLFIPSRPPFDLYDPEGRTGLRLYVKRVFILDDCKELLPEYLRFVRGVVDSDDLPLNVSREMLQADRVTRAIRKTLVSKVLGALETMAEERPEDYTTFWNHFGTVLKAGMHTDPENRERIAKLLRWPSSKAEITSLDEYLGRAAADSDSIYYSYGQTLLAARTSPHIEALKAHDIEVLYMADTIDEWVVDALPEYEGKKLVSAMKADLDLDEPEEKDEAKQEEQKASFAPLLERAKQTLGADIEEVRLSRRLKESPSCLVVPDQGMHAHVQRLLEAQGQNLPQSKRILELNPTHPVVQRLQGMNSEGKDAARVDEWMHLLYEQALLAEGSPVPDPQAFAKRMTGLMTSALGEAAAD